MASTMTCSALVQQKTHSSTGLVRLQSRAAFSGSRLISRPSVIASTRVVTHASARSPGACDIVASRGNEYTPESLSVRNRVTRLAATAAASILLQGSCFSTLPAEAFDREIFLSELEYTEQKCPPSQYVPARGKYVCLNMTATADNASKRKVEAADVFGFIYDVEDNSAASVNLSGNTRTVIGSILQPVPIGKSKVNFTVVVTKASVDKGPLKFKAFKAEPNISVIEERFKPFSACEIDPEDCL